MLIKHWEYTEVVDSETFDKFKAHKTPISTTSDLPANTAVFISNDGKRLEGVFDPKLHAIRPLKVNKPFPNRDLRLYMDAINNPDITMIAVDGLMGTGKTSTAVESAIQFINDIFKPNLPLTSPKVVIAKPYVYANGEEYGFLPGGIDEKFDPSLVNFIQYFDRWHQAGFSKLRDMGYIKILPLGFIRGLDAEDLIIIADECQNTRELISLATRKSKNSRIFYLGDTSPFQIDLQGSTPHNNGLTKLINLLQGAPYFQYIELKSLEHVVRSPEVRDIVKRLFDQYGEKPQDWTI
ncbi:MAG: PhoH family protein [Bacteroidota bacterium]|nr:PhoH family protein [Bacteroidota bacterium]